MNDVMTRVRVTVEGKDGAARSYALGEGESVLDGLLREGVAVPNSCRAGACQSCLMQVTAGTAPAEAQKGLKEKSRGGGDFLACAARPLEDLTVQFAQGVGQRVPAVVREIEKISRDVV